MKRASLLSLVAFAASVQSDDALNAGDEASSDFLVYVGTYTGANSKGIHLYRFDARSGEVESRGLAAETRNPSWVELHPSGNYLYAVGEIAEFRGKKSGAVSAYAIDRASGELTPLNRASSGGTGPCHLAVDRTGRSVFVANYGSGSVAMLPVHADGRVGEPTVVFQHEGSSVNERRQKGPHAHGTTLSADNRFLFVPDLGIDRIQVYRYDEGRGTLQRHALPFAALPPGAGPRHFALHPNQEYAYCINELSSTVTILYYLADRGVLSSLSALSTLPSGFEGPSTTAEIEVHPSGKFLYGSNRGHDSIAVFSVSREGRSLRLEQNVPTQGKTPRNFAIDPTGRWLWVANQGSGNIVLFEIDRQSGKLEPAGVDLRVGSPVCLKFLAVE